MSTGHCRCRTQRWARALPLRQQQQLVLQWRASARAATRLWHRGAHSAHVARPTRAPPTSLALRRPLACRKWRSHQSVLRGARQRARERGGCAVWLGLVHGCAWAREASAQWQAGRRQGPHTLAPACPCYLVGMLPLLVHTLVPTCTRCFPTAGTKHAAGAHLYPLFFHCWYTCSSVRWSLSGMKNFSRAASLSSARSLGLRARLFTHQKWFVVGVGQWMKNFSRAPRCPACARMLLRAR